MTLTPTRDWTKVTQGGDVRDNLTIHGPAALALAFEDELRSTFPINQVPQHLIAAARTVHQDAKRLTQSLHEFALSMANECGQKATAPPVVHMGFGPRDVIRGSMCGEDGAVVKDMGRVTCPNCTRVMEETAGRG